MSYWSYRPIGLIRPNRPIFPIVPILPIFPIFSRVLCLIPVLRGGTLWRGRVGGGVCGGVLGRVLGRVGVWRGGVRFFMGAMGAMGALTLDGGASLDRYCKTSKTLRLKDH